MVGVAVVTALGTSDDSQAQLPGVTTPSISTPPIAVPPLTIPPVRVQVPPVSVPGTTVQTPPVTVQTPPVTTPKVQVPSVTTPKVQTPPVTVPKVQAPQATTPSITPPSVTTPSGSVTGPKATSPRVPSLTGASPSNPSAPRTPSVSSVRTPPESGDGGLGSPSSPRQADTAGVAALAGLGVPSAAALREASPARRRQLLRLAWDAPLRRDKLRRLRHALVVYGGCLDDLSAQGRRTLVLRAGLGGGKPASRRAVARRLGVPLKRELRVESGALRQLTSAGRAGRCGGAAAAGGTGSVGGPAAAGGSGSQGGRWDGHASGAARGGVLGVSDHGGGDTGGASKLDFIDRTHGAANALLLLALAILGPLGVALLATRSGRAARPPRT